MSIEEHYKSIEIRPVRFDIFLYSSECLQNVYTDLSVYPYPASEYFSESYY